MKIIFLLTYLIIIQTADENPSLQQKEVNCSFEAFVINIDSLQYDIRREIYAGIFRDYIDFEIKNIEHSPLQMEVYDRNGNILFSNNYGYRKTGQYRVVFNNSTCTGVFIVRIILDDKKYIHRIVLRESQKENYSDIPVASTPSVNGKWHRAYSKKIYSDISYPYTPSPITAHNEIMLELVNGRYTITWNQIIDNTKRTNAYYGKYLLENDIIKFIDAQSATLWREYGYTVTDAELQLCVDKCEDISESYGYLSWQPMNTGDIILVGKYLKNNK